MSYLSDLDDDSGFIQRDANEIVSRTSETSEKKNHNPKDSKLRKLDQKWQSGMKASEILAGNNLRLLTFNMRV